jgi:hypothetical protein
MLKKRPQKIEDDNEEVFIPKQKNDVLEETNLNDGEEILYDVKYDVKEEPHVKKPSKSVSTKSKPAKVNLIKKVGPPSQKKSSSEKSLLRDEMLNEIKSKISNELEMTNQQIATVLGAFVDIIVEKGLGERKSIRLSSVTQHCQLYFKSVRLNPNIYNITKKDGTIISGVKPGRNTVKMVIAQEVDSIPGKFSEDGEFVANDKKLQEEADAIIEFLFH